MGEEKGLDVYSFAFSLTLEGQAVAAFSYSHSSNEKGSYILVALTGLWVIIPSPFLQAEEGNSRP